MPVRKRILLIYTGGTIGMIEDPATGALKPFDFDHLIDNVPKVRQLDYEIDHVQFAQPIDSSDITLSHWQEIARTIERHYADHDGFVVLHGTDTMAYTASALSFMLEGLRKPVIITGSQLPIGEVRTDGEENLITALQIAAAVAPDGKRPQIQEVAILFEDYLWRGNRSTKMSADNFNAFKSNNYPPLARIGLQINFNPDALWRPHMGVDGLRVHYDLDPSVSVVSIYPGLTEKTLRHMLAAPEVRGVVLRTYGAGNATTEGWFVDAIADAISRGIVMVNVSQCPNGGVDHRRYFAGNCLEQAGVISGHDLTVEAALTKLMFLFGLGMGAADVKRAMRMSIRGEMTTL